MSNCNWENLFRTLMLDCIVIRMKGRLYIVCRLMWKIKYATLSLIKYDIKKKFTQGGKLDWTMHSKISKNVTISSKIVFKILFRNILKIYRHHSHFLDKWISSFWNIENNVSLRPNYKHYIISYSHKSNYPVHIFTMS